ncbi:peptide chain release factor N(5)-glutamine methyltransferase [Marinihelvus fidelis]|uniref:Release factor glutamine methyltransferase n=1 Tax=Marinihelvus fidelis TaxID=2613842 RepID=A0A5N0TEM7_9GAMM|nr:peptide chain release factor N(5)-glutamine methyltransferase [Marinihelvus fidelis]KAA9133563.1 peptide chain release factor N(5)-glutamine methyltransferase [Marinihelvus fidelis]
MNIGQHLEAARADLGGALRDCPGAHPGLEAEILMAEALETPRSFLYAHPELEMPPARGQAYRAMVERRMRGEPIAYITGTREFWSLTFRVTPEVLVPRPETELLVETALERLAGSAPGRIADLGTGSGAIACALASERRGDEVTGTDISYDALEIARANAGDLGLHNTRFVHGSWCAPLDGSYQCIVSNPPYIAAGDPHLDHGDCRFEPRTALTPGGDGLAPFHTIARDARGHLSEGGWLLFEHGNDQGEAVRDILTAQGYERVETCQDLERRDRVTLGLRGRS